MEWNGIGVKRIDKVIDSIPFHVVTCIQQFTINQQQITLRIK